MEANFVYCNGLECCSWFKACFINLGDGRLKHDYRDLIVGYNVILFNRLGTLYRNGVRALLFTVARTFALVQVIKIPLFSRCIQLSTHSGNFTPAP